MSLSAVRNAPLFNDHGQAITSDEFLTSNLVDLVAGGAVAASLPLQLFSPSLSMGTNPPVPQLLFRDDLFHFPSSQHASPLQILAMDNVLVSLADQARQSVNPPSSHAAAKRIAKVVLTDGAVSFVAIEKGRCSALDVAALGAKVMLVKDPKIRNGVVMLTDENIVLLGGAVARLAQERALWLNALAKQLTGAPSTHPALQDGPVVAPSAVPTFLGQGAVSHLSTAPVRASTPTLPQPSRVPIAAVTSLPPPQPPLLSSQQQEASAGAAVDGRATTAHAVVQSPMPMLRVQACIVGICEALSISPITNGYSLVATLLVTQFLQGDIALIGGGEIECDLGHPWLMELIGMRPEDFVAMSEAAETMPEVNEKMMETVHRVGKVLETYQEGIFDLKSFPNKSVANNEGCRALFCVVKQRRIV